MNGVKEVLHSAVQQNLIEAEAKKYLKDYDVEHRMPPVYGEKVEVPGSLRTVEKQIQSAEVEAPMLFEEGVEVMDSARNGTQGY